MENKERIIVAMSGGVDSSVAAALMVEQGHEVIGITLQLYDHGAVVAKSKSCCAGQDIADARKVCEKLDIPHYVLDYESLFRQEVIDEFADSYIRGQTPIPCVRCNQTVKFRDLLKVARDLKGAALVTGHYVQRLDNNGIIELHRGDDHSKDQSYFLFATNQEQLDYLHFPLGGMSKAQTRAHADRFGLNVADKTESQDICFVPTGDYKSLVEKLRPESYTKGNIIDMEGNIIGQHDGIIKYTIGQRKGLGIGGGDPLYVVHIDPVKYEVIVGPESALYESEITIELINWLGDTIPEDGYKTSARLRSVGQMVDATIFPPVSGKSKIMLNPPQKAISPGQACVLYEDERVLGGGWIL